MAGLTLTPNWDTEIRQLETTDLVAGGESGVDNTAPRQLGNRIEYLERRLRNLGFSAAATGTAGTLRLPLVAPHRIGPRWVKNGPFWRWTGSQVVGYSWNEGISFPVPFGSGVLLGFEYRYIQIYDAGKPAGDPGGAEICHVHLSDVTYEGSESLGPSYVFARADVWGQIGTHTGNVGVPVALGGYEAHSLNIYPAFSAAEPTNWTLDICNPVAIIQL